MLGVVADILRSRGSQGWLVGGGVRDRMLGRYSPDLDVAVADDAAAVAKELASALRAPWFTLSERHPTYRVLGSEGYIDIAAVRGEDIVADLAQRDFTVNAMALPVASAANVVTAVHGDRISAGPTMGEGLVDPFGGAAHLREGCLVAVSDHIFTDDPLRLMRAPRFCHTLGLRLDEGLARRIREQAPRLNEAAAERVVTEMCLTLDVGRSAEAVGLWEDLGLLAVALPELGIVGASSGTGAASEEPTATLALLHRLDDVLQRPAEWFPETAGLLSERLGDPVDGAVSRPVALRLAGLMSGLTLEQTTAAGRRLRLSGAMVSLLSAASRCIAAGQGGGRGQGRGRVLADLLPEQEEVTRPAVLFLWEACPWEPEVLLLTAAAESAGGGRDALTIEVPGGHPARNGPARRLMALHAARASGRMPSLPLDGEVLMRELGLESGPLLGRVLREARLAWEAGEARTVEEVLALARRALATL